MRGLPACVRRCFDVARRVESFSCAIVQVEPDFFSLVVGGMAVLPSTYPYLIFISYFLSFHYPTLSLSYPLIRHISIEY